MFKTRDSLKAAAIKSKSVLWMEAYKNIRKKANALNTRHKKRYFTDKIHSCKGNIKENWTTINKLIIKRSKTTNITSLRIDEETIAKPDLIAESMNKGQCKIYHMTWPMEKKNSRQRICSPCMELLQKNQVPRHTFHKKYSRPFS